MLQLKCGLIVAAGCLPLSHARPVSQRWRRSDSPAAKDTAACIQALQPCFTAAATPTSRLLTYHHIIRHGPRS